MQPTDDTARQRLWLGAVLALILLTLLGAAGLASWFATGGEVPAPMIGIVGLGGAALAVMLVLTGARGRPARR